jgi:hypothetical protein
MINLKIFINKKSFFFDYSIEFMKNKFHDTSSAHHRLDELKRPNTSIMIYLADGLLIPSFSFFSFRI